MPLMTKCCCFSNTKDGSIASAIYSLIWSASGTGLTVFAFISLQAIDHDSDNSFYKLLFGLCITEFVVAALVLITSILLLCGVCADNGPLMIPYCVAMILYTLEKLGVSIVVIVTVGGSLYIGSLIGAFLFGALNILCVVCVISEYQVLRTGYGEFNNVQTPSTGGVI